MKIVPVIISGGVGSRLWPLSRDLYPKPFISFPERGTLIGGAYRRATRLEGVDHVVTVTNRELLFRTCDEYAAVATPSVFNSFLLEPFGRDTAAAIALSAAYLRDTEGPDAIMVVMPADHIIDDQVAFGEAVKAAARQAAEGKIVLFTIKPTRPETGYGYIEIAGDEVERFVEKPDAATAASYVESGRFFWNSGIFCFSAKTMIAAMEEHCPAVLAAARKSLAKGRRMDSDRQRGIEVDAEAFAATPSISVDYAVMEKAGNKGCVACTFDWSDVGSWDAVYQLYAVDERGNAVTGEVILHDAASCYVHSEDRLVGLAGVSNLIVVDTPDALLVADKDRAQEVRVLYNQLKSAGHEAALLHRKSHRPWGTYTVLEEGDRFKIKRIEVKPGARLSLQAHHHRSEHWIVVSGTAKVVNGNEEFMLATNQSTYVPCGMRHRLENPGILPLVLIEVQSGDYLGEDDIVRFDDQFGRS